MVNVGLHSSGINPDGLYFLLLCIPDDVGMHIASSVSSPMALMFSWRVDFDGYCPISRREKVRKVWESSR